MLLSLVRHGLLAARTASAGDDRGVSPVIAVVLMVGLTIVAATLVSVLVFNVDLNTIANNIQDVIDDGTF